MSQGHLCCLCKVTMKLFKFYHSSKKDYATLCVTFLSYIFLEGFPSKVHFSGLQQLDNIASVAHTTPHNSTMYKEEWPTQYSLSGSCYTPIVLCIRKSGQLSIASVAHATPHNSTMYKEEWVTHYSFSGSRLYTPYVQGRVGNSCYMGLYFLLSGQNDVGN